MLSRNCEEVIVFHRTRGCFVASRWYVVIKGQNCFFLRKEDRLTMQECGEIIACVWSYGFSLFLSHSAKQKPQKGKWQKQNVKENLKKQPHFQ